MPFSVTSRWFEGACAIPTYDLDELLGTKLRALYQRDLFDLALALEHDGVDPVRVVQTLWQCLPDHSRACRRSELAAAARRVPLVRGRRAHSQNWLMLST